MIISNNVGAQFLYTIGPDNKRNEIVPLNKVLYESNKKDPFDLSRIPEVDLETRLELERDIVCKQKCKKKDTSSVRRSGPFRESINRPNGILTTNDVGARNRRLRAEERDRPRAFSNLTQESIRNPPTVRMIDRRLPTIATGTRGPQLFPAGTRTCDSWNQENPGKPTVRISATEKQDVIRRAIRLNRQRIERLTSNNNRLRLAPKRKKRCRLPTRQTFAFV